MTHPYSGSWKWGTFRSSRSHEKGAARGRLATICTVLAASLSFIGLGTIGASAASTSGTKHALTTVSVSLEYTPGADNVALWLAQNLGYFTQVGIKARILPYTPSTTSDSLVAAGKTDVGISASEDEVLIDCGQSLPVTAIYAIVQTDPGLIGVTVKSGITSPRQLEGTTYAGFGTPEEPLLVKALIQAAGGKGIFKVVTLATASYQAVESGHAQSSLFYDYSDTIQAKLAGAHLRYFSFEKYGIPNQYGPVFIVNNSFLAHHPTIVRGFLSALMKGYEYEVSHVAAAAKLIGTLTQHTATFAFSSDSLKALAPLMIAPKGHPLGYMTLKLWADRGNFWVQKKFLHDASGKVITKPLAYSTCYTNKYL